jgi:DNA-binding transcriptional ArsR family regulator
MMSDTTARGVDVPNVGTPAPDEAVSDEAVSNEAVSDEAVSNEAVSDEAVSDEAVSDEAVSNEAVPTEPVPDRIVSDGPGFEVLVRFCKALGDETRLRLVMLLAQQETGRAMCVSRLARELETTAPNISQHLNVLKDLDLVHSERRRYRIHYFLNRERLARYVRLMRAVLGDADSSHLTDRR